MDDERWLKLVDSFHAAALSAGSWLESLSALAEATGSRSGQLVGLGSPAAAPFNWASNVDPEWADQFFARGGSDPLKNPSIRAAATSGELEVISSAQFTTEEERRRNDFVQWSERSFDLSRICLTPLIKTAEMHIGLAVMRSVDQGEIDARQRAVFASIAPHVRSAVRTQLALEHQGALLVAGAMEALDLSVFVCDRGGRVKAMTPSAEALVRAGTPLRLQGGILGAADTTATRALRHAIAVAAGGLARPGRPPASTVVVRDGDLQPLALEVVSLGRSEHAFGFEPRALVIARTAQGNPERARALLQSGYGLTGAEAEVALSVARGQAPESIATARGAKVSTVRAQIRSIFAKLGVRRLNELAAKVQRL